MNTRKLIYRLLPLAAFVFLVYTVYMNFVRDPGATAFLAHKAGQAKQTPYLPVWLGVKNIHIVAACLAAAAGALNFPAALRSRFPRFHRTNGAIYLASVLVVDLSSGYMAPYATGGLKNSIVFNMLNLLWPLCTAAAIVQIRKKRAASHRKWMIRSYAFIFTNPSIHLIAYLLHNVFGAAYVTGYTVGVYAAIPLLLAAAELVIRRTPGMQRARAVNF